MKQKLFLITIILLTQFAVSLKANAGNTVVNKGTITIYVGEEKTMYHSIPYQYYTSANSWFLRDTSGSAWSDGQEECGAKIVSKTSESCTIKGMWDNDGALSWCELHCKGTKSNGEYYECYWKVIVKSYGDIFVDANPSFGDYYNPTMVEAGTKVYLSARTSNGSSVSDAKIYYTTDGSWANQYSTLYTSAGITINKKTYISAMASKSGYNSVTCGGYFDVKDIPVTNISLNKSSLSLQTGQSETLIATLKPDNATDKTVTWSSSNNSIATVTSSGKVTAVAAGSATITCKANDGSGKQATCAVTVTDPYIRVTSITLNKSSLSLQTGQSETLIATVKPDNATDKTVTWSSSNNSVATVTSSGKVTAVAAGNATITCKANDGSGVQATCSVTVTDPVIKVTSITLNKSSLSLQTEQNETLIATVKPDNATDKTVTWSSSNNSVATVTSSGKVTAVAPGNATITCKANDGSGKQATCAVTVTNPQVKGDVNGDGYVNGTDLVALTNIILGKSEEKASADVNGDGYVNGTDYVVLVNIILGKSNARTY